MSHAVDVAVETDKQTKLGNVLDLAFDFNADREGVHEGRPRVFEALLQAQ